MSSVPTAISADRQQHGRLPPCPVRVGADHDTVERPREEAGRRPMCPIVLCHGRTGQLANVFEPLRQWARTAIWRTATAVRLDSELRRI
jgi:hypothetical protein